VAKPSSQNLSKPADVGLVLGQGAAPLWGMSSSERLRRSLARAGVAEVVADPAALPAKTARVLAVRADWVFDQALIEALVGRSGVCLEAPGGEIVAANLSPAEARAFASTGKLGPGVARLRAEVLVPAYDSRLRKLSPPYLLPLTPETLPAIERRMFDGSYKGVTDAVTKYLWPRPAQTVTKLCARLGVTPNQVTVVSALLTALAFWLFWRGDFAPGLLAAWGMTFLDTVDGKLARVTLTSSRWGNVFDHGLDLLHPPFWWWAWIVGLANTGYPTEGADLTLLIAAGGYVLLRAQEGVFIGLFGMEMHIWRRFDSRFRLVTSRRNPNLVLLTLGVLAGRPDLGMAAVAVWTVISLAVHTVRILQALFAARPLSSWMQAEPG
jgi:phosphatidylglycerophosphate synthase